MPPAVQSVPGPQVAASQSAAASTQPPRVQTPQGTPSMTQSTQPPAPPSNGGVTIPGWFLQVLTLVAMLTGGIMMFARMSADIDKMKETQLEMKAVQTSQAQEFVTRQIFDMKMTENEKYQYQMNQRFDKLEGLINGLYDRLPAKRSEK